MTEIVKVQRPIASNDADPPWLIYNKQRNRVQQVPGAHIPQFVKDAMGMDYKAYFHGEWFECVWALAERVEAQPW